MQPYLVWYLYEQQLMIILTNVVNCRLLLLSLWLLYLCKCYTLFPHVKKGRYLKNNWLMIVFGIRLDIQGIIRGWSDRKRTPRVLDTLCLSFWRLELKKIQLKTEKRSNVICIFSYCPFPDKPRHISSVKVTTKLTVARKRLWRRSCMTLRALITTIWMGNCSGKLVQHLRYWVKFSLVLLFSNNWKTAPHCSFLWLPKP